MKKLCMLTALAVGAAVSAQAALVITEVAEGTSGTFKYMEITNTGASSVNLASPQVAIRLFANGVSTPTSTFNLSGTIASGAHIVVANNSSDYTGVFSSPAATFYNTVINNNGDDAFQLYDVTNTTVLDSFGGDWVGSGTSGGSDTIRAACNGVYFRIASAYPNNGNWGGANNVAPVADGASSPSGFWKRVLMTASNGNASTIGTPFATSGVELPVELDAYVIE